MIQENDRKRQRLQQLFASMPVEPVVSYQAIIDGVRKTPPPESVWGLARDIACHLTHEPDSFFPIDESRVIRRGMAQRWVHSAVGIGDVPSAREDAVVEMWERMHFAGVPPLRSMPLGSFARRYERVRDAVYPLGVDHEAPVTTLKQG